MKARKYIVYCSLFIMATAVRAQWDYGFKFSKAGSAGLQFLKIGIGARESAMGEAGLAVTEGVNAIFWNPAGIGYIEGREATFSYNRWLLGIDLSAAAVGVRIGNLGVVGFSAIYMGVPPFEETTVLAQEGTGRMVSAGDLAIGLCIAKRFTDKLVMGGQIRWVREELDQDSFSNILLDIGAIYDTGFHYMRISVCAQHFGPDIRMLRDKFRMPLMFKVGLSDDVIHGNMNRLTVAVDLVHPTDNTERMNFGLEYAFYDRIFLRGGYRANSDLGEWSFGAGLRQSLLGVDGSIDYAYGDFGEIMGGVNRFTVSFGF